MSSPIRVQFSEPVDRSSAEAAFALTDGTREWGAEDGTFAWSEDGKSFTFVPATPLAWGRRHEVRLAGNLTDIAGNPMGEPYAWSFTTEGTSLVLGVSLGLAVAAVTVLLALLLWRRRRKTPDGPPEGA